MVHCSISRMVESPGTSYCHLVSFTLVASCCAAFILALFPVLARVTQALILTNKVPRDLFQECVCVSPSGVAFPIQINTCVSRFVQFGCNSGGRIGFMSPSPFVGWGGGYSPFLLWGSFV